MAKTKSELKEKPRRVIIRLYRQFDIDLIYMFEYLSERIEPESKLYTPFYLLTSECLG